MLILFLNALLALFAAMGLLRIRMYPPVHAFAKTVVFWFLYECCQFVLFIMCCVLWASELIGDYFTPRNLATFQGYL